MTPRPRERGNKDLPPNLYSSKKGEKTYYQYKHPNTGKYTGFGTDRKKAVDAAKQLNQILSAPTHLADRVTKTKTPFRDFLIKYRDDINPAKRINGFPLSKKTLNEHNRIITKLITELGHIDINKISQSQIAEYLNEQSSAETHNKHRSLLVMIYRHAISDGLIEHNIPERILKRDKDAKKRNRLTLEQYKDIYKHARPAIRNAMELSLNGLQRRTDIQHWRFDNEKDGFFYIIQSKTRKHGKSAFLRIPTTLPVAHSESGAVTLADIVKQCKDRSLCPFVIHERPERQYRSKEKQHPFQLSGKQISDGFAQARELAGIKIDNPPTFHELLSLGQYLREKQGWTLKEIQTLRGHTKEITTKKYMDDIEWTTFDIPPNM